MNIKFPYFSRDVKKSLFVSCFLSFIYLFIYLFICLFIYLFIYLLFCVSAAFLDSDIGEDTDCAVKIRKCQGFSAWWVK